MTTTVKVIATQRVTVRPDVTENVTVVIKAVGPQGPTGSSTGDMTKVVYDPTNVLGDAFAMDNMAEGTLTKIMTSAERTKLAGIQAGATVADTASEVKIKYEANADTNAFTDAEKTLLGNQSGTNTGDQDLSGFESAGTAAGLISDHELAHPIPTVRDTRNQIAGSYAPALGADDNYVTDAEKIVIGNTSGTNTGDQDLSGKENVGVAAGLVSAHETTHPPPTDRDTRNQIAGSYAPALGIDDNYVTDAEKIVIGNTSGTNTGDNPGVTSVAGGTGITSTGGDTPSLSHDAHTGDVTGSTALTLDKTAITGKSVVTADDADYVLLSDTSDSGNLKKALKSDFGGGGGGGGLAWEVISANDTAADGEGFLINATSGDVTLTLPATPSAGNTVGACDAYEKATTNTITIARNGENIESSASDLVLDIDGSGIVLVYVDSTVGWKIVSEIGINLDTGAKYKGATIQKRVSDGSQSIADSTFTVITFPSELRDTDGFHDPVTNNSRLTIPSGVSKVTLRASLRFAANATGFRAMQIKKNGGSVAGMGYADIPAVNGNITVLATETAVLDVIEGDYFEVEAYQTSGGNLNLENNDNFVWFSIDVVEAPYEVPTLPAFRGAYINESTNQSINDSTWTAITYDEEVYDTDNFHDNSTNTTRLTVPAGASRVRLAANGGFGANATGRRQMRISKNGGSFVGMPIISMDGQASNLYMNLSSGVFTVVEGDYFECECYQTSGAALAWAAGDFNWFSIEVVE